MSNLWRRAFGPRRSTPTERLRPPAGSAGMGDANAHRRAPLPNKTQRGIDVFVHAAHSFWTGNEAKRNLDRYDGRELMLAKVLRIVQGNGHMLSAIYHMLDAKVSSEITCPSCNATIRAPYAENVKSG